VLVTAVLVVALAACNNPDYSRSTVERDLTNDAGLTASQAHCLARGLEIAIGVRRLGSREAPNQSERDLAHAALVYAIVACSGSPFRAGRVARDLHTQAQLDAKEASCLVDGVAKRVGTDTLANDAAVNLTAQNRAKMRVAIAAATIACGGNNATLRRTVGFDGEEAACALRAGQDLAAIKRCTVTTTTTTTTTTIVFGATTTTG
jgi:hypothetical protein